MEVEKLLGVVRKTWSFDTNCMMHSLHALIQIPLGPSRLLSCHFDTGRNVSSSFQPDGPRRRNVIAYTSLVFCDLGVRARNLQK